MSQSRRLSLIEAVTNVTVGYGLAVATQIVIFPWFGLVASLGENLAIGLGLHQHLTSAWLRLAQALRAPAMTAQIHHPAANTLCRGLESFPSRRAGPTFS
jgi:hypothetical protein